MLETPSTLNVGSSITGIGVRIEDTHGNLVNTGPDASRVVTLEGYASGCTAPLNASNPAGGASIRDASATASGGIASFTANGGVKYTTVENAVVFRASSTAGGALTTACSPTNIKVDSAITNAAGAPFTVTWSSAPPTTLSADSSFSAAIEVKDQYQNFVTGTPSATLSAHANSICSTASAGTLGGTATKNLSNGSTTFSSMDYRTPTGTIYLKATVNSVASSCAQMAVNPGTATKLAWFESVTMPSSYTIGTVGSPTYFSTQPKFRVKDNWGNNIQAGSSSAYNVTITAYTDAACSIAAATQTLNLLDAIPVETAIADSDGVVQFSNFNYLRAYPNPSGIYLKASAPGLAEAPCSTKIAVNAGPAANISYDGGFSWPANLKADSYLNPGVNIYLKDDYGNAVSQTYALEILPYTNSGCTTLADTSKLDANSGNSLSSGQITFAPRFRLANQTIYWKALLPALSKETSCSPGVNIIPGDPKEVKVVTQPSSPNTAGLVFTQVPKVEIWDAVGNKTSAGVSVSATVVDGANSACTGGEVSGDYAGRSGTTTNGEYTFAGLSFNKATNGSGFASYRLKVTSTYTPALTQGCSGVFTIDPSTANKLAFNSISTGTRNANQTFAAAVNVVDVHGNVVTSIAPTNITLTPYVGAGCSGSPGVLTYGVSSSDAWTGESVNTVSGQASYPNLQYRVAGTYSFKAEGGGFTAACSPTTLQITPVDPAELIVVQRPNTPQSADLGNSSKPIFEIKDSYGNLATGASYEVMIEPHFNSTCTSAANSYWTPVGNTVNTSSGQANFSSFHMKLADTFRYKVTVTGFPSASLCMGTDAGNSAGFVITPGAPNKIAIATNMAPATGLIAGQNLNTVSGNVMPLFRVTDQWGNWVNNAAAQNYSIGLTAFTNSSCTTTAPSQTVGDVNGVKENSLDFVAPLTDSIGQSLATDLIFKLKGTFYFRASSPGLTNSPCTTAYTFNADVPDYMQLRSGSNNGGLKVASGANYNNQDIALFSAVYDRFGNYISDVNSNWTAWRTIAADKDTAISPSKTNRNNVTVLAQTAGDGLINITATNSAGYLKSGSPIAVTINNVNILYEVPSGFFVEVIGTPPFAANQKFGLRLTAKKNCTPPNCNAGSQTVSNYIGEKTVELTHNQATSFGPWCSGNQNNTLETIDEVNFVNGVAEILSTNEKAPKLKISGTPTVTAKVGAPGGFIEGSTSVSIAPTTASCLIFTTGPNGTGDRIWWDQLGQTIDEDRTYYASLRDMYDNYIEMPSVNWSALNNLAGNLQNDTGTSVTFRKIKGGLNTVRATYGAITRDVSSTVIANSPVWTSATNDPSGSSKFMASNKVKDVYHYTTETEASNAWTTSSTTATWYTETPTANFRMNKAAFPRRVHLFATEFSLEIIDATFNRLWMRLNIGSGRALDSDMGIPTSVKAINGKVLVGMRGPSNEGGLLILDFPNDTMYKLTASQVLKRTGIANRDGNSGWVSSSDYPELASNTVNKLDVRSIGGQDYVAIAHHNAVSVMRISGTTARTQYTGLANVRSVKLTSDQKLYYGIEGVGLRRSTLNLASMSSSFSPDSGFEWTVSTTHAPLSSNDINSIDVAEGLSQISGGSGQHLVLLGTKRGLVALHEHPTATSSRTFHFTTTGSGLPLYGRVADFDGIDDYITLPHKAEFPDEEGNIEFYFRPEENISASTNKTYSLFYKGSGGSGQQPINNAGNISIRIMPTGNMRVDLGVGGSSLFMEVPPQNYDKTAWNKGERYHVSLAWDWDTVANSLQATLWINGSRVGKVLDNAGSYPAEPATWSTTSIASPSYANFAANTSPLVIGASSTGASTGNTFRYRGILDELRIRDVVPSGGMTSNFAEPTEAYAADADTIYLLHFDSNLSSTVVDSATVNPTNGSYVNGALNPRPLFAGTSIDISTVIALKNGSSSTLHIANQLSDGGWSEIRDIQRIDPDIPVLEWNETGRNSVGMSLFHVNGNNADILLIRNNEGVILRRRTW